MPASNCSWRWRGSGRASRREHFLAAASSPDAHERNRVAIVERLYEVLVNWLHELAARGLAEAQRLGVVDKSPGRPWERLAALGVISHESAARLQRGQGAARPPRPRLPARQLADTARGGPRSSWTSSTPISGASNGGPTRKTSSRPSDCAWSSWYELPAHRSPAAPPAVHAQLARRPRAGREVRGAVRWPLHVDARSVAISLNVRSCSAFSRNAPTIRGRSAVWAELLHRASAPSSEPWRCSSSRAVFAPIPGAPGRPSEGSPRSAMKSATSSGAIAVALAHLLRPDLRRRAVLAQLEDRDALADRLEEVAVAGDQQRAPARLRLHRTRRRTSRRPPPAPRCAATVQPRLASSSGASSHCRASSGGIGSRCAW